MKKVKSLFVFFAAIGAVGGLGAQTKVALKPEDITVFVSGAQLTNKANIVLVKGENEFVFTNVAADVNTQSVSINAGIGIAVESVTFLNNYLSPEAVSPHIKALKDSIELLNSEKQQDEDKVATVWEQVEVLKANRKVSGNNNGLSTIELQKMLDLVNSKMENLLNQKSKTDKQIKKIEDAIAKINRQIDEEKKKGTKASGQLAVKFYTDHPANAEITLSYVVASAGWSPSYDVRVDDISKPVKLYYKANVYQNTGVLWDNVHLILSTGNPNEGAEAPVPEPWQLSFYTPPPPARMRANAYKKAMRPAGGEDMAAPNGGLLEGAAPSSMSDYVAADNSGINTFFDIELPYTIPTDGQQHLVSIKKYDVPANYRYFAVPKLDKDAFMQAQITNWEEFNLMPGKTNVFFEGTFVGQGKLDFHSTSDTLNISLGRDKKIIIKRERDTKYRSVRTVGMNVHEAFGYNISIRNTRKEKVNLILQDQLPVSTESEIEVGDVETGGSTLESATGLLNWNLQLNPNEVQNVKYGFMVKYPKGKTVDHMPK